MTARGEKSNNLFEMDRARDAVNFSPGQISTLSVFLIDNIVKKQHFIANEINKSDVYAFSVIWQLAKSSSIWWTVSSATKPFSMT